MYAVSPRRQQKKIETYVIISIYLNIGGFKLRIGVIRKTPAHYYSTLYNTLPPTPQNTSLRTHIHTHFANRDCYYFYVALRDLEKKVMGSLTGISTLFPLKNLIMRVGLHFWEHDSPVLLQRS